MRLQFRDIPTQLKLIPKDGTVRYDLEVSQVLKIHDEEPQKTVTQWEVSITYSSAEGKGIGYTVQFSDPIYNGVKDYTKLEWLYARVFSVFKRLEVVVTPQGGIHAIQNKQDIAAHWEVAKSHIKKSYSDASVDDLIDKTENLIYNKLDITLVADPLFDFLFNDNYLNYGEKRSHVSEKLITGHFGSNPYPIFERKSLTYATNNDKLAIVKIQTDLDMEKWPTQNIDHYLGTLIGDLDTTDYLFARTGSYILDIEDCNIMEGSLEVIGKIPNVYSKTTLYNLKQKQ